MTDGTGTDGAGAELSDGWIAAVADDERRRNSTRADLDVGSWEPIDVPGHWRNHPAFADSDGPLLYRHAFTSPPPDPNRRSWLVFDGVHQQGDVWLDGNYVGDIEGSFVPHDFEVTELLTRQRDHVLSVEVASGIAEDRHQKRGVTGTLQNSEYVPPNWNPGGIWAPVRVEETGPVRLRFCRIICDDADEASGTLTMRAVVDAADVCEIDLRTTIEHEGSPVLDHRLVQPLAAGENRVEWAVTVPSPKLWWPRALGDQPIYDVRLDVDLTDGTTSDTRRMKTGFRTISQSDWITSINGERLFLKGACLGPQRPDFAALEPSDHVRDIALAIDAGLDLVRVTGHIARPEFYDEADRVGLLVWQDFPLHRGHARSVRKQAVRQAREAVDLLAHHPSVFLWCVHDEPDGRSMAIRSSQRGEAGEGHSSRVRQIGDVALRAAPTWTKTVLDRSVKRAIEQNDRSRPVISHSGVLPSPPRLDGAPSHLFFGWDHGLALDLEPLLARLPRFAMFVAQFGAQAAPLNPPPICGNTMAWPDIDWAALELAGVNRHAIERFVPPDAHEDYERWAGATQRYQAELIRHTVETLRRLKYRPSGGFAVLSLAESFETIGYGVTDHRRQPKLAYDALARSCSPVLIAADRFPPNPLPGDLIEADVHLVNDHRHGVSGVVIATVTGPTGPRTWRWQGSAPADSCVRIGTLETVVPRHSSGAAAVMSLDLIFEDGDGSVIATNRYDTRLSSPT